MPSYRGLCIKHQMWLKFWFPLQKSCTVEFTSTAVLVCVCVWLSAAFLMFRIKSPSSSLLCWAALSKQGWMKFGDVEVYPMAWLTYLFFYLLISFLGWLLLQARAKLSLDYIRVFLGSSCSFGAAWIRLSFC